MHIGLVCNEYPPAPHGGIGSSSQDLAQGLVEAGHRVTIVGTYTELPDRPGNPIDGLKVVRLPSAQFVKFYRPRELWNRVRLKHWLLRAHRHDPFDLVEVPDYEGWLPWPGRCPRPIIAWLHGSNRFFDSELNRPGDAFTHGLEQRSLIRADFWLGVSDYAFRRTLALCGLKEKPGQVIPQAVDADLFSPGPAESVEPGLIVFVNTLNAKKGVPNLIAAAQLVFASHPHTRLVLIGGADTKAGAGGRTFLEQMQQRVEPEFRDRILFTGRLERGEIVQWLRKAGVCCYPSSMETFGIAPVEAMSVGRPTIFTSVGPGPEVIEDGVSGLLCNPDDAADLAEKIRRILDDPAFAAKLGAAARRRVLALFNKREWIQKHIAFYRSCLGSLRKPE